MTKFQKRLWIGLAVMAALTPVGLILPERFGAGDAWGEWGPETIKEMLGFVPKGLERLASIWKAPLADYGFGDGSSPAFQYIAYILSGIVGVLLAWAVFFLIKKMVLRREKENGR